jgi:hypothetical protein
MKPSMSEEATRYFSCATTANISKKFIPLSRLKGLSIYDHFREHKTNGKAHRQHFPGKNVANDRLVSRIEGNCPERFSTRGDSFL